MPQISQELMLELWDEAEHDPYTYVELWRERGLIGPPHGPEPWKGPEWYAVVVHDWPR